MATVQAFIRFDSKGKRFDKTKPVNVRFRLRDGRQFQFFYVSELVIIPEKWDAKKQEIKAKVLFNEKERTIFNTSVSNRKTLILNIYTKVGNGLTYEILESEIKKQLFPELYEDKKRDFFDIYGEFIENHAHGDWQRKHHKVIYRCLKRFELYSQIYSRKEKNFKLTLDEFTQETIKEFVKYIKNEPEYFKTKDKYEELKNAFPEKRDPKLRGRNYINGQLSKLRTFFIWCKKNNKTKNQPFEEYEMDKSNYGTPIILTKSERDKLYDFDLSNFPELEKCRDIFVFQCFVGCRISDLFNFTQDSIVNDEVTYIAHKTKDINPKTVRVPLSVQAKQIIKKYEKSEEGKLLPFPKCQQYYNELLKDVFRRTGLNRKVITLNPISQEFETKYLYELASSHLARRTFIGLMVENVKDCNLVSELSGHVDGGSRALKRYYNVTEKMRKDMIKAIE